MARRRLAYLMLGCLLGGILLSPRTARSIAPTGYSQEPSDGRKVPPRDALRLEIQCWNQDEVKEFLIFAINQGAPLFNGGDPYGCYRIYDFAAKRIIWVSEHCPDRPELAQAGKTLQMALKRAEAARPAREKAWVLRQAIDTILEGDER